MLRRRNARTHMPKVARVTRNSRSTMVQTATALRLPSARINGTTVIQPTSRLVLGVCARLGIRIGTEDKDLTDARRRD